MAELFRAAAKAVREAEALLITAGAGMGVDSGLPDFRGPDGFWRAYPPYRHLRLGFAQLANARWFREDPELAWGFYGHRLNVYRSTVPHAGFGILRKWGGRMAAGLRVFTSNVDGQFQKAGFGEEQVTEAHGSIHYLQCTDGCAAIWPAEGVEVAVDPRTFRAHGWLPRCRECGALARPNILMFGDDGWRPARSNAQEEALDQWVESAKGRRLVVVECGAGSAIPTVRRNSEYLAQREGVTLIRVNVREPEAPEGHLGLAASAGEGLTTIDSYI